MVLFVCGSYFPSLFRLLGLLSNRESPYREHLQGRKRRRNGAYVGNVVPLNSITSDSARSTTIRVDT